MKSHTPPSSLASSHLRTYEKIFQHPLSHNLPWRDVLALFSQLGEVVTERNGNLRITLNGHPLVMPTPHMKDVAEVKEMMKLRHFLEQAEAKPVDSGEQASLVLVVIDHHRARLFDVMAQDSSPREILFVKPDEHLRHGRDTRDPVNGKAILTPGLSFEPVAQALKAASRILIFGTGTGASCEMVQFTAWLKKHHAEIAGRVAGERAVDERHLTDGQLLAQARELLGAANGVRHPHRYEGPHPLSLSV